MKTTFNKSQTHFGCYDENQINAAKLKATFTIQDVLNTNVPLTDKGWFIANRCELTDTEKRQFAIGCALIVLHIYESKYPYNKAPRKAIEEAQAYLAGNINIDELRAARRAAIYAAIYAAADTAYAAAAAAYTYTADAAAAAAYTYTAYALSAAAYAYTAAAAKNDYKTQLLNFFKEFVK